MSPAAAAAPSRARARSPARLASTPRSRMGAPEAVMGVGLLAAFYCLVGSFGLGPADALAELPALVDTRRDSSPWTELLSSPSTFKWVYGTTPASTVGFVLMSLTVYLGGCLGLQRWMSSRPAYETGPELRGFTLVVLRLKPVHNGPTPAGPVLCTLPSSAPLHARRYTSTTVSPPSARWSC
jgi:hypothetical protein